MILDDRLEFLDATDCKINTTNNIIGDVIDLGATPTLRDIGNGEPLYLVIQVTTAATGAGNITFELCSDSTANLATSKTVHVSTGAIAYGTWTLGYTKIYALPMDATYERYLGLWETGSGNTTALNCNAFLTTNPAKYTAYDDNSAIV